MRALNRAWNRHRRENRFLLGAFVFLMTLATAAFYLLQRAQNVSPDELTNRLLLFILWYLDISLILILSFVLIRNVFKLVVEWRSGILGGRFRTKLVLTYVALTFVPVIFIFLIATNLLQRSIDRWFSSPVEEILLVGSEVTVELREAVEGRLAEQAAVANDELGRRPSSQRLARVRAVLGVDLVAIYDGGELVQAVTDPRRLPAALPPLALDELPRSGVRADRWRSVLLVRAWQPMDDGESTVVVGTILPRKLLQHLDRATAAHVEFQEMKVSRGMVTSTTVLVFLAITLLILFGTVWTGLYLSRRFTEPMLAVADATRRVAGGDELAEVVVPATDEMAVLVDSFNAMVRRVKATEADIRASANEMATLLATIPTGVLTVDAEHDTFRANPAAAAMLGHQEWAGEWRPLGELDAAGLDELCRHLADSRGRETRFDTDLESNASVRHVEVTITPLAGGGSVVAIDDLTQLVAAQRQAAWSEVAQRIAHEIKNPLTPIQLAAERIHRHAGDLDPKLGEVVSSGCDAIVAQVSGLKQLVDSFREYARMPSVKPRASSISRILREVVSLYDGIRDELSVELELPAGELWGNVDPVLLSQALVNLLDNSIAAIPGPGAISVAARADGHDLVLEVADTGVGLPTDDPEILLRPFFSTKGRGSGIGLALVHRIVTEHGGTLAIANRARGGAVVTIVLVGAVLSGPPVAARGKPDGDPLHLRTGE
jgi:nitrogen fixation/metabolism regulation signal transduction histidine kinase